MLPFWWGLLIIFNHLQCDASLAEVSDSEEEEGEGEEEAHKSRLLTYSDEQEELKESFKGAVDEMEEEEEEGRERGEVLTLRKKSEQEKVKWMLWSASCL